MDWCDTINLLTSGTFDYRIIILNSRQVGEMMDPRWLPFGDGVFIENETLDSGFDVIIFDNPRRSRNIKPNW